MRLSIYFILFLAVFQLKAQNIEELRNQLSEIISTKNATIGISIKGIESKDTLNINGNLESPMMSVFKFHIALAVLDLVDQKKLKLNQKIFVKKEELLPNTWSPIREDFPEGNLYLTLDQLLRYTVSHSDNNGCDILLELVGGTESVQKFINDQGIKDFTIKVNEHQMRNWENLRLNTTTPLATTELLEKFFKGKILKKKTTKYLYQIMTETSTGLTWIKAGLPEGTEFGHRTGNSGVNQEGIRIALNNVGIVTLPSGKHFILSIYMKDIQESGKDMYASEKTLAEIAKTIWNYFVSNS